MISKLKTIPEFLHQCLFEAAEGNISPLDVYIYTKEIENALNRIKNDIKELAIDEAQQYDGQIYQGYEIKLKSGGGRYVYSNNPDIIKLQEEIKRLQNLSQQAYKTEGTLIDDDGAVVIPAEYVPYSDVIQLKKHD